MTLIHREITETGEVIDRPFTAEEIAEVEAFAQQKEKETAALENKIATREAALAKLGLTADEITALFG